MFLIQLLVIATIGRLCNSVELELIVDFLEFKQSKSVIFLLCQFTNLEKLYAEANQRDIFVRYLNIDAVDDTINPLKVLPNAVHVRTTCVADYSCESSLSVLQKFSDHHFFNITYSWLFVATHNPAADVNPVLNKLRSIQMNSDLTVVVEQPQNVHPENTTFDLLDVYAPGQHLCKDIYSVKYGEWSRIGGLTMTAGYRRYSERHDFKGLQLRGVTVIDQDNITSQDVDQILASPRRTQGVVSFVRYHYALLCILRDYHNFTIKYRIARGWAGRLKNGFRLGLLGILARNEADVATTAVFQRLNRHAEFDFIHHSYEFEAGFLFRMTPQLSDSAGSGNFLSPFETNAWIASAVTALSILVALVFVASTISKKIRNERNDSAVAYFIDIIGTFAQQGLSSEISPRLAMRVIVFSLLFMSVVLYNYYTSAVVGGLLSSLGDGPKTIDEMTRSPLTLSFLDIGYHKILFQETKNPSILEMYKKKVQPSRGSNTIPVYTDIRTAVPYLKRGGYAFHCELTEAFQDVADQFDAYEICELRTGVSLFSDLKLIGMILPKRSMYTELFKTTLMRAKEIGIIKRNLKIHKLNKPVCQAGSRVLPVELNGVAQAFVVLGVGIGLSLIIIAIENLWWRSVLKRQPHMFLN